MIITKIERQKGSPNRVNIYLDGGFALGVHEEVLLKSGFKKGDGIDEKKLEDLKFQEEINLSREKAFKLISIRMRSEKELRSKLREKEFHPDTIDKTINHLKNVGILNDRRFAQSFANDLMKFKPSGRKFLIQALKARGVSKEIIEDVLNEKFKDVNEVNLAAGAAQKLLNKYKKSARETDKMKQQQRVVSFLARRGFEWSTVKSVIKELFGKRIINGSE